MLFEKKLFLKSQNQSIFSKLTKMADRISLCNGFFYKRHWTNYYVILLQLRHLNIFFFYNILQNDTYESRDKNITIIII